MSTSRLRIGALAGSVILAMAVSGSAAASRSNPSVYLTKITLSGCNTLYLAFYYLGDHGVGTNSGHECTTWTLPSVTTSVAQGTTYADFLVWLYDASCDAYYYDLGGTTANHATVTGTKHRTIDIADAGGGCGDKYATVQPARGEGNLSLVEAIH